MIPLRIILEALVAAVEEVDPGGGPAFLSVLSEEAMSEIAKANWPGDPEALKEAMRQLVAETSVAALRPSEDATLH